MRGFGGPQVYFALERLMQRIAETLGLDPLEVIRRNLVDRFPHRCPAGAVLDSGDYRAARRSAAVEAGGLAELRRRRDAARAEGRLYGIGYAAVVEPSISNMGYITTVLSPEERRRAGPKSGAQAAATRRARPARRGLGDHRFAAARPGPPHRRRALRSPPMFRPRPRRDPGRERARYRRATPGRSPPAIIRAALPARSPAPRTSPRRRLRDKLARIAAAQLEPAAGGDRLRRRPGRRCGQPGKRAELCPARRGEPLGARHAPRASAMRRCAKRCSGRRRALAAPNDADEINSSAAYGFVFDFCGVEIDRDTGDGAHRQIRDAARCRAAS